MVDHQLHLVRVVKDCLQHAAVLRQLFQRFTQLALVELALAPQMFALQCVEHPNFQDVGIDGLVQKVHCTQGQATDMRIVIRHRGHEDDRNVAGVGVGLQALCHLEAIHARHHHVQQQQLWPVLLCQRDGIGTVACFQHLDTLFQYRRGDQADGRGVINDQDRHVVQGEAVERSGRDSCHCK